MFCPAIGLILSVCLYCWFHPALPLQDSPSLAYSGAKERGPHWIPFEHPQSCLVTKGFMRDLQFVHGIIIEKSLTHTKSLNQRTLRTLSASLCYHKSSTGHGPWSGHGCDGFPATVQGQIFRRSEEWLPAQIIDADQDGRPTQGSPGHRVTGPSE